MGRSREGAWIEISSCAAAAAWRKVAPVRERGLKLQCGRAEKIVTSVAPVRERGLKLESI